MSLDVYLYYKIPEDEDEQHTVFDRNMTHNLNKMASECSETLYKAIWRPEELFYDPKAKDVLPTLKKGLEDLKKDPTHYKQFEPENKWGTYAGLIEFLQEYIAACEEYPEASIRVSR